MRLNHLQEALLRYLSDNGIKPETDIDIYLEYPSGWEGVFGANQRVYVYQSYFGMIRLKRIEPMNGFTRKGRIILKGEQRGNVDRYVQQK